MDSIHHFAAYETQFPYIVTPTRNIIDLNGDICPWSINHHAYFNNEHRPISTGLFAIKLAIDTVIYHSIDGKSPDYVWYFVHPTCKKYISNLSQITEVTLLEVTGLALSSGRTFLIDGAPLGWSSRYGLVKIGVDVIFSGRNRRLSAVECLGSIGTSQVLSTLRFRSLEFHLDHSSYFPKGCDDGNIVRGLPDSIFSDSANRTFIPFLSILSISSPILDVMILRSGLTPSEFITQTLLIPFCDFIVEGLFESHVSIEAHAQNLGWIINQETLQPIKLAYRDMGGVNILNIESTLSGALSNSDYYFSDKHCKDAAATIETHFVSSLLFALTKRFVNTNYSSGIDSDFRQWADLWASAPYRINWTTDSDVPDRHATDIPQDQFVRYGYIELMFGRLLTMKLKESGIFDRLAKQYSYLKNTDTTYYDNFCNNHTVSELFRPMILTLYSHYLELSP